MGLKKPGATAEAPVAVAPETTITNAQTDSGAAAAVARLNASKKTSAPADKSYQGRDFNAEARGKTRCVQFEAALQSPAIAGMKFKNMDEYLELCRKAADYGLAYTFGEIDAK